MDNYIPSGKWPSFLALSIIFFSSSSLSMMIFLTSRFEKTQNASSRKNEDVSVCLSVCLSLSLSRARVRRGKEEQTTQQKPSYEKASSSSSHSRSKKSNKFARRLPRKEEEEDKRERVLSLYCAVLRAKEIERCDFWFLPFVCARLCVVSGKRERERVAMMML